MNATISSPAPAPIAYEQDDEQMFNNLMRYADQLQEKQSALATGLPQKAVRAMALYSDWAAPEPHWPKGTLSRNGMPYAFHERLGRWVPTSESIGYFADIRDWLEMMDDRKDYTSKFQSWYDHPRPSRAPYVSFVDNCDDYEQGV
jgi:hypothetical protein